MTGVKKVKKNVNIDKNSGTKHKNEPQPPSLGIIPHVMGTLGGQK